MRIFLLVLISGALAAPAYAQEPEARFTLAQAVAEAVARHPDIAAAKARHDAALQRPRQARSLPDPMVSAGWTSVGNPLPGAGIGREPMANVGVMVSQEVPFPGKRGARAAVASREAEAQAQEITAATLRVTSRVRQAYFALGYARAAAEVLDRNRELLATIVTVSEQRYAVGKAAQQDVIKAQTQLSILQLQQERLSQTARAREGELNALLARPTATPIGALDALTLVPFGEDLSALLAQAGTAAPLLERERIMIDRSRLAVDVARLDFKPDFTVSGGYAFMGDMPAGYEFRVGVTIPLQRGRRHAAVAEQQQLLRAAERSFDGVRLELQERIHVDREVASTASRLALLYRDTVLPQARLALESSLASYQTGAVDFLSVLTNFSMVLEYEITYFEQLAELHQAISRLEEMTGSPIAH